MAASRSKDVKPACGGDGSFSSRCQTPQSSARRCAASGLQQASACRSRAARRRTPKGLSARLAMRSSGGRVAVPRSSAPKRLAELVGEAAGFAGQCLRRARLCVGGPAQCQQRLEAGGDQVGDPRIEACLNAGAGFAAAGFRRQTGRRRARRDWTASVRRRNDRGAVPPELAVLARMDGGCVAAREAAARGQGNSPSRLFTAALRSVRP